MRLNPPLSNCCVCVYCLSVILKFNLFQTFTKQEESYSEKVFILIAKIPENL